MALVWVLLSRLGRSTDQKITWLAGWLHQSHIATVQSVLSFQEYGAEPKSDTELLLIVTSWELHPPPSLFALSWILSPDWPKSLHFESLLTFPRPCFSWQVSDWSSLDMHKRRREEEVGGPQTLQSLYKAAFLATPLVPPRLTQPECFCNWRPAKSK